MCAGYSGRRQKTSRGGNGSSLASRRGMRRRVVTIRTCASCGGELRQSFKHAAVHPEHHAETFRAIGTATYTCIVCGVSQMLPARRASDLRSLSE